MHIICIYMYVMYMLYIYIYVIYIHYVYAYAYIYIHVYIDFVLFLRVHDGRTLSHMQSKQSLRVRNAKHAPQVGPLARSAPHDTWVGIASENSQCPA